VLRSADGATREAVDGSHCCSCDYYYGKTPNDERLRNSDLAKAAALPSFKPITRVLQLSLLTHTSPDSRFWGERTQV
jgi:hypothetical protein